MIASAARWPGLALASGLALLAALWIGQPWHEAGHGFTGHMIVHMGVVALAAPLLALGLGGLDPARIWPRLFAALPASLAELLVVWGWHLPAPHRAAHHSGALFALEQASFLAAGLWLWLSCLGSASEPNRMAAGVAGLLLTALHMTLLGVLLALAPRPLYAGPSPASLDVVLADQQAGGLVMLGVGGTVYLAGGLWLLARLLRRMPEGRQAR